MQRKVWPPADTRSPLAAFVDEHTGTIESGDVGPLIGQAALAFELFFGASPPEGRDEELRALLVGQ